MQLKRKRVAVVIVIIIVIIALIILNFNKYKNNAKKRLSSYNSMVKIVQTSYGTMSYIDEGNGNIILVAHGLFGGYDQGYDSMKTNLDNYRIIAPSRFGYVGTDLPENSTMRDQVKEYVELLDQLGIDKTYVLGTSAGGAIAMTFALEYPDRVKGLILYCSAAPGVTKLTEKEIVEYSAPPPFACNDFIMWAAKPFLQNWMNMNDDVFMSIFPINERRKGVINDGYHANADMSKNFDDYPLEEITCPVLVVHSEDDKTASYKTMEQTVPRFKNCTFVHFKDGAHMMKGHDAEIAKALDAFISSNK